MGQQCTVAVDGVYSIAEGHLLPVIRQIEQTTWRGENRLYSDAKVGDARDDSTLTWIKDRIGYCSSGSDTKVVGNAYGDTTTALLWEIDRSYVVLAAMLRLVMLLMIQKHG